MLTFDQTNQTRNQLVKLTKLVTKLGLSGGKSFKLDTWLHLDQVKMQEKKKKKKIELFVLLFLEWADFPPHTQPF